MGNLPNPHSIAPASSVMNVAGYNEQYQAKQNFDQYLNNDQVYGHKVANVSGIPSGKKVVVDDVTLLVQPASNGGKLDISVLDSSPTTKYKLTYETTTDDAEPVVETVTVKELLPGADITPQAAPTAKPGYAWGGWTNEPPYMAAKNIKVTGTFAKKDDPTLAWSAASAEVTIGADDNVFPTLTNSDDVPVGYESSDTSVAEINATTGVITLKAAGTTVITCTSEETEEFAAKAVTYELTVNASEP